MPACCGGVGDPTLQYDRIPIRPRALGILPTYIRPTHLCFTRELDLHDVEHLAEAFRALVVSTTADNGNAAKIWVRSVQGSWDAEQDWRPIQVTKFSTESAGNRAESSQFGS